MGTATLEVISSPVNLNQEPQLVKVLLDDGAWDIWTHHNRHGGVELTEACLGLIALPGGKALPLEKCPEDLLEEFVGSAAQIELAAQIRKRYEAKDLYIQTENGPVLFQPVVKGNSFRQLHPDPHVFDPKIPSALLEGESEDS